MPRRAVFSLTTGRTGYPAVVTTVVAAVTALPLLLRVEVLGLVFMHTVRMMPNSNARAIKYIVMS